MCSFCRSNRTNANVNDDHDDDDDDDHDGGGDYCTLCVGLPEGHTEGQS